MEDWVKILMLFALLAVVYKATQLGEKFSTTSTPQPSMGTSLVDATGLPLTDSVTNLPLPNGCQPPASIDTDLLPKPCVSGDDNYKDFTPNPAALTNMNFLDATKYIGESTVAGSLRNSSYDIRGNIPVPSCPGAWGNVYQSVIQPDPYRKSLCDIEGCGPTPTAVPG